MKIEFQVLGLPIGGGSKKVFPIRKNGQLTGRFVVTDSSGEKGKNWRQSIVAAAFEAMHVADMKLLSEPLILRVDFFMPRPKYHFDRYGHVKKSAPLVHSVRPDATKLTRALEDALTNVLWSDDALVCEQIIRKRFGDQPGARVTVSTYASEMVLREEMPKANNFVDSSI